MRSSLLYNPRVLVERLAIASQRRRRRQRLRGTPAAALGLGYLDSLELLELLKPHPPHIIYDIGANIGTWTCLAKSLFPAATVEAFEPMSCHSGKFQQWTRWWPADIRLHASAIGAKESTALMNVMSLPDASSFLAATTENQRENRFECVAQQSVPVIPLDMLAERENLPLPDLIKLDVQGFELAVMEGAVNCLTHASAVICEVSFREIYVGQALFPEILNFLAARGFSLEALGEATPAGSPLVQTDVLFVRRASADANE